MATAAIFAASYANANLGEKRNCAHRCCAPTAHMHTFELANEALSVHAFLQAHLQEQLRTSEEKQRKAKKGKTKIKYREKMFDATSLIHLGNCSSIKKSVASDLYMYMSKRRKHGKDVSPFLCLKKNYRVKEGYDDSSTASQGDYQYNFKWEKHFCFVKANFFYVYKLRGDYRPCAIFLLEKSEIQAIERTEDFPLGENEDVVHVTPLQSDTSDNAYAFYSPDKGVLRRWLKALNSSNFTALNMRIQTVTEENEEMKTDMSNVKRLNEIEIKNRDIEIGSLHEHINSLKVTPSVSFTNRSIELLSLCSHGTHAHAHTHEHRRTNTDTRTQTHERRHTNADTRTQTHERRHPLRYLDNTRTKNKRLQIAADVNIKSADELLQKKMVELEVTKNEVCLKVEGMHMEKIKTLTSEAEKRLKMLENIRIENSILENKLKEIMMTYEEASTNPEKITLINFNTNERYQKMVLSNKKLREEIIKMNIRFYEQEDKYKEKLKTIKEIIEIGDIFDYLHKLILLCQTKIKFYEHGHTYNDDKETELLRNIEYMIKETKLAETNARVCYISHRSKLLEERLLYYTNKKIPSDYFYFACTTLRRLGWVFGEIEVLTPLVVDNEEVYPLYSYIDNTNVIPMRENIYFNEGIEGRGTFQLVNEVDMYSMPTKMCPYKEKVLTDNKYNYIKIKLMDLKNDFNILKKKNKPNDAGNGEIGDDSGRGALSDLQWTQIKRAAYDRLERAIVALDRHEHLVKP
ncbi:conserved Plasmodium protein, unknown function [Plasmodium ovale wallikeri]|uniref:PH domain-containing protein n=1 Tax=Plasmodium ovale wallikeri TaxID=864142 RepID=A0A1A8Z9E8_PLAOA|nr:conserved Plasmodium protein, unknown function [Plasmodium ovale wallikeri]